MRAASCSALSRGQQRLQQLPGHSTGAAWTGPVMLKLAAASRQSSKTESRRCEYRLPMNTALLLPSLWCQRRLKYVVPMIGDQMCTRYFLKTGHVSLCMPLWRAGGVCTRDPTTATRKGHILTGPLNHHSRPQMSGGRSNIGAPQCRPPREALCSWCRWGWQ